MDIVEQDRQKTYAEDLEYLDNDLGGLENLASKLETDVHNGILTSTAECLDKRDKQFGTNKKKPFKRTSKKPTLNP